MTADLFLVAGGVAKWGDCARKRERKLSNLVPGNRKEYENSSFGTEESSGPEAMEKIV